MQSHWLAFPRFQAEVWPSVTVVLRTRAPGQACVGFPPLGRIGVHVACFCKLYAEWFVLCCCFAMQSFCKLGAVVQQGHLNSYGSCVILIKVCK